MLACLLCFILFLPALGCVYIRDHIGRFFPCHFYHSAIAGQLIFMVIRAVIGAFDDGFLIIHDFYTTVHTTKKRLLLVLFHMTTLGFACSVLFHSSAGVSDSWLILLSSSSFRTPLFRAFSSSSWAGPLPAHRIRQFSSKR